MRIEVRPDEVVLVILEYLQRNNYIEALRSLEHESSLCAVERLPKELMYFRNLLLDGAFENAETLLQPLVQRSAPVYNQALFAIRKQLFLETVAKRDATLGATVLVEQLRGLEPLCSAEQFNALCFLPSLTKLSDQPEYVNWTPHKGRMQVFESLRGTLYPLLAGGAPEPPAEPRGTTRLDALCAQAVVYQMSVFEANGGVLPTSDTVTAHVRTDFGSDKPLSTSSLSVLSGPPSKKVFVGVANKERPISGQSARVTQSLVGLPRPGFASTAPVPPTTALHESPPGAKSRIVPARTVGGNKRGAAGAPAVVASVDGALASATSTSLREETPTRRVTSRRPASPSRIPRLASPAVAPPPHTAPTLAPQPPATAPASRPIEAYPPPRPRTPNAGGNPNRRSNPSPLRRGATSPALEGRTSPHRATRLATGEHPATAGSQREALNASGTVAAPAKERWLNETMDRVDDIQAELRRSMMTRDNVQVESRPKTSDPDALRQALGRESLSISQAAWSAVTEEFRTDPLPAAPAPAPALTPGPTHQTITRRESNRALTLEQLSTSKPAPSSTSSQPLQPIQPSPADIRASLANQPLNTTRPDATTAAGGGAAERTPGTAIRTSRDAPLHSAKYPAAEPPLGSAGGSRSGRIVGSHEPSIAALAHLVSDDRKDSLQSAAAPGDGNQAARKSAARQPSPARRSQSSSGLGGARFVVTAMLSDPQAVRAIGTSRRGDRLAVGTNSKKLMVCSLPQYTPKAGQSVPDLPVQFARLNHHLGSIYCLSWSRNDALLATGSNSKIVKIVQAQSEADAPGSTNLVGHSGTIRDVAFSPVSDHLVSGGAGDCDLKLWDTSGQLISSLHGHRDAVFALVYVAGGAAIVSGARDNTVRVWDVRSGAAVRVISTTSPVSSVDVNPGGDVVAAGLEDGSVLLWNLDSGEQLSAFSHHKEDCRSVQFSASGRHLLTGACDYTIGMADVAAGTTFKAAEHADKVVKVCWNPNAAAGQMQFASASADKTVRLWSGPSL